MFLLFFGISVTQMAFAGRAWAPTCEKEFGDLRVVDVKTCLDYGSERGCKQCMSDAIKQHCGQSDSFMQSTYHNKCYYHYEELARQNASSSQRASTSSRNTIARYSSYEEVQPSLTDGTYTFQIFDDDYISFYSGYFKNGYLNGAGKFVLYLNGEELEELILREGIFENGNLHGQGMENNSVGETLQGTFKQGELIDGTITDSEGHITEVKPSFFSCSSSTSPFSFLLLLMSLFGLQGIKRD